MGSRTKCLLIVPAFPKNAFFNRITTCELFGAGHPAPPLGLLTVAGMLPDNWELKLVDRNVEAFDPGLVDWADLVMTGGMISQHSDLGTVVQLVQDRGKPVVLGGPEPTDNPELYGHANHLVLGEAEVSLAPFLADLRNGQARARYDADGKADMETCVLPRYDLLKMDGYLNMAVEHGRGCPFACEFCQHIVRHGSSPRSKSDRGVLAELQSLYDLGYRGSIEFVSDNFIGNRMKCKGFLEKLGLWLAERDHPFEFSADVSLDIAEDDVLLGLMKSASFNSVFIGFETPDAASLSRINKHHNVGRSLEAVVARIHRHGMFVSTSFILGLDSEPDDIADQLVATVAATAVPIAMAGPLYALPSTLLRQRLDQEGRLSPELDKLARKAAEDGDFTAVGLNFETTRPRHVILGDVARFYAECYEIGAFADRVCELAARLDLSDHRPRRRKRRKGGGWRFALKLLWNVGVKAPFRWHFWKSVIRTLLANPKALPHIIGFFILYIDIHRSLPLMHDMILRGQARLESISTDE